MNDTHRYALLLHVLIETLWNVNIHPQNENYLLPSCINRNIVECKLFTLHTFLRLFICINRNIVECKCLFMI